jgi:flagellar hook-length control protein FliK
MTIQQLAGGKPANIVALLFHDEFAGSQADSGAFGTALQYSMIDADDAASAFNREDEAPPEGSFQTPAAALPAMGTALAQELPAIQLAAGYGRDFSPAAVITAAEASSANIPQDFATAPSELPLMTARASSANIPQDFATAPSELPLMTARASSASIPQDFATAPSGLPLPTAGAANQEPAAGKRFGAGLPAANDGFARSAFTRGLPFLIGMLREAEAVLATPVGGGAATEFPADGSTLPLRGKSLPQLAGAEDSAPTGAALPLPAASLALAIADAASAMKALVTEPAAALPADPPDTAIAAVPAGLAVLPESTMVATPAAAEQTLSKASLAGSRAEPVTTAIPPSADATQINKTAQPAADVHATQPDVGATLPAAALTGAAEPGLDPELAALTEPDVLEHLPGRQAAPATAPQQAAPPNQPAAFAEAPAPVQPARASATPGPVMATPQFQSGFMPGSDAWLQELGTRIDWLRDLKLSSAELFLHPAELGTLEIRILAEDDNTSVAFITQNAAAKELIEGSLPRLRELLAQSGLQLDQSNVEQQSADNHKRGRAGSEPHATAPADNGATPQAAPAQRGSRALPSGRIDHYV